MPSIISSLKLDAFHISHEVMWVKAFYMPDDDEYNGYGTSSLHHTVLQYLLHPDGHVGDILGYSLNPLHQAGWLKPAHTQNKTQT